MPCYHPVTAWYSATKNASGKRPLVFAASGGFGSPIQVPCNNCIGCRLERARQWAIRCMHEAQLHEDNCFVTLTYSDEHLPSPATLVKRHHQLFLKRLRKHLGSKRVRYFLCGEYGEQFGRPHYHLVLFGHAFLEDRRPIRKLPTGEWSYTSDTLTELWGLGQCELGTVTLESAGYVARYSLKKINGDLAEKHYTRVDPQTGEIYRAEPEYGSMSLKPGIGSDWFDSFKTDVYPDDFCVQKGKKLRVPRYYDNKLPEHELAAVKAGRKKRALQFRKESTPARLAVREEVKRAKLQTLQRTLK